MSTLPRIIVTGGSGFLGRRLVGSLLGRARVVGIGRRPRADLGLAGAILKLVALRAAGELERSQAEAEMMRLASFPILSPNPVVEADAVGTVARSSCRRSTAWRPTASPTPASSTPAC